MQWKMHHLFVHTLIQYQHYHCTCSIAWCSSSVMVPGSHILPYMVSVKSKWISIWWLKLSWKNIKHVLLMEAETNNDLILQPNWEVARSVTTIRVIVFIIHCKFWGKFIHTLILCSSCEFFWRELHKNFYQLLLQNIHIKITKSYIACVMQG